MTTRHLNTGGMQAGARWIAAAALASVCAVTLSACEGNGSTAPPSEPAAAAPDQGSADLMGAPPPPPPGYAQVGPPQDGVPPGAPGYGPGPGPYGPGAPPPYPPGPPYGAAPRGPVEIIAMAPIPNPPEEPRHSHEWRAAHHRHHQGWWGPVYAGGAVVHHGHRIHSHIATAPAHLHAVTPVAHHARHAAAAVAAAAASGTQLLKPKAPHAHTGPDAATVAAATGGSSAAANGNTAANTTGAADNTTAAATPEDQRYDALQSALTAAFAHEAVLGPSHLAPGQTTDVTLTVPGDFGQTLRTEAAKQNLSDQAASANLEATLAGDGYSVVPAETQALPLTLGAATVFHWKVTPQTTQGASPGPLHADVHVNLLGSNRSLTLGSIKSGGGGAGRVFGIGLLVLIAAVLIGWVMQSRRRPKATGATRPRSTHQNSDPPTL